MRSLSAAVVLVAGCSLATAARVVGQPAPLPDPPGPPIQSCYVDSIKVDGIPVSTTHWCTWDRARRRWIPLISEEGQRQVFGIRPTGHQLAPPIPKHQRPLE